MGLLYGINLDNIDWELLIKQKEHLINVIMSAENDPQSVMSKEQIESLDGILYLLDAIDDKIDAGDFIIQSLE
jgi:hypothetical protein